MFHEYYTFKLHARACVRAPGVRERRKQSGRLSPLFRATENLLCPIFECFARKTLVYRDDAVITTNT